MLVCFNFSEILSALRLPGAIVVSTIERHQLFKRSLNIFLILFGVMGTVLVGMLILFYQLQTENYNKRIRSEERHSVDLQLAVMRNHFDSILSDLSFLAGQEDLRTYLESPKHQLLTPVSREYQTFSASKRIYDQIRFLNESGQELVRVNYRPDSPEIVAQNKLQDKSKRYYFADAFKLAEGEVFISPLDLNIERGQVEVPYKPMMRFGAPVFNQSGEKRGIVLLNYLAQNLLDLINDVGSVAYGETMLVNAEGFWLQHPDQSKTWGFILKERHKQSFANEYPHVWQQIAKNRSGQIKTQQGIFTFATIVPHGESLDEHISTEKYSWKIISHLSASNLQGYSKGLMANLSVFGAVFLLLGTIVAWLLALAMTRRKLYQAQLFSMAHYDELTALPNRTLFFDRLNQALQLAKRHSRHAALLYVDLDGFKYVNDSLGHDAGDELLIAVGKRMAGCCRSSDTLARLGGDEFALLMSEIASREGAGSCAEKILDVLQQPFQLKRGEASIGASIGIGIFPSHGGDLDALLKSADQAMYVSKSRGKNRYTFADSQQADLNSSENV